MPLHGLYLWIQIRTQTWRLVSKTRSAFLMTQRFSRTTIWGCILKGCFGRGIIFWRAKSRLKGIQDFNLEHWLGPPNNMYIVVGTEGCVKQYLQNLSMAININVQNEEFFHILGIRCLAICTWWWPYWQILWRRSKGSTWEGRAEAAAHPYWCLVFQGHHKWLRAILELHHEVARNLLTVGKIPQIWWGGCGPAFWAAKAQGACAGQAAAESWGGGICGRLRWCVTGSPSGRWEAPPWHRHFHDPLGKDDVPHLKWMHA